MRIGTWDPHFPSLNPAKPAPLISWNHKASTLHIKEKADPHTNEPHFIETLEFNSNHHNMAERKPAYVFVGGVSHTPLFFESLIKEMATLGYESTAVAFPTCGENTETVTQWEEVTAIQKAVKSYLGDQSRDVILVLHSYGGWPGSRAIKTLDKETRNDNGKSTSIIEVVFIAAFLLPDNAPVANYSYLPPWLTVEVRSLV